MKIDSVRTTTPTEKNLNMPRTVETVYDDDGQETSINDWGLGQWCESGPLGARNFPPSSVVEVTPAPEPGAEGSSGYGRWRVISGDSLTVATVWARDKFRALVTANKAFRTSGFEPAR